MGKNLFDFGNEEVKPKEETKEDKTSSQADLNEGVQDKFDKYKTFSRNELEAEIEKEVRRQKANGTFNYAKIVKNVGMMRSYLTPIQFQSLMEMLERLR